MVPAAAVREYLERELDDFRWMKGLTHKEMDRKLDALKPAPVFWHELGLHQKIGLYLGIKYESFAYWYDMGTGKTLLALELMSYWWSVKLLRRGLIFITSDTAFSTWEKQIYRYKIGIPFVSLDESSSEEKWRMLDHFGDGLVILTYPGTVAMVSEATRKKGKTKWVLSDEKLERLFRGVDALVMDESTKVGIPGSLQHKLVRRISTQQASFRYALAGRPFGRDPTPLWAQMFLVDHGETLGPTLGLFREAFFNAKENYWSKNPYSKKYTFKKEKKKLLSELVQHRSLTYTADECIDLPPERRWVEEMRLPSDTREYYRQVVDEVIEAKGNMRAMKSAFLRMRQLSSGFLGLRDDETGERAEIEFEENPKLDRLLELVEEAPEDTKLLVFYEYTYSGRLITAELENMGLHPTWLWAGTKNPKKVLTDFIEKPRSEVGVIQSKVGAYSLDGLQEVSNYTFFYESPVSVIDREQAERRTKRQGQRRRTVFYCDLIVKDTMDAKILDFHREGEALFDALLRNPARMLRK